MKPVPVYARQQDWPRLAAQAVNAVQGDVATLQTDTAALAADVTALEGDVTALQTATDWSLLADYADDTAAATGGVAIGQLYRTGSAVKVRVA